MVITHLAHASFRVKDMEASLHFYEEGLGLKRKFVLTEGDLMELYVKSYAHTEEEASAMQARMERRRDEIGIVYFEITPGQFIELFSADTIIKHVKTAEKESGYLHYALEVDDIFATHKELLEKGIKILSDINMGPDQTYQLWIEDPDGNEVELMQYTERSYQLIGRA